MTKINIVLFNTFSDSLVNSKIYLNVKKYSLPTESFRRLYYALSLRRFCGSVSVFFPITMMVTGMVGNSLAMLLVYSAYRKKENKRKKSFLLCIGSLALTDLVGQLLTTPIVISVYRADLKWKRVDPSGTLCVP
uniref:Prostaglandin E2 receptor EP3 subtype n=1 Tax=Sinocyclocheilus anshuiensis TaxID=1608454 RepID=A0A671SS55_9TELE